MQNSEPVDTPMSLRGQLYTENSLLSEEEQGIFRSIAGSLLYIVVRTKPDIAVAASTFGPFVAGPTRSYITDAKKVLRYLRGTEKYGFIMKSGHEHQLIAYGNANCGGNVGFN